MFMLNLHRRELFSLSILVLFAQTAVASDAKVGDGGESNRPRTVPHAGAQDPGEPVTLPEIVLPKEYEKLRPGIERDLRLHAEFRAKSDSTEDYIKKLREELRGLNSQLRDFKKDLAIKRYLSNDDKMNIFHYNFIIQNLENLLAASEAEAAGDGGKGGGPGRTVPQLVAQGMGEPIELPEKYENKRREIENQLNSTAKILAKSKTKDAYIKELNILISSFKSDRESLSWDRELSVEVRDGDRFTLTFYINRLEKLLATARAEQAAAQATQPAYRY